MTNQHKGAFISFEGADGSGKTTASKYLLSYLQEKGHKVFWTREPGGSELAERIRALLFEYDMSGLTEALLFSAARADHIQKVILPKIEEGYIVLCDRYVDSSFAYQARGRGFYNEVLTLEAMVAANCMPAHTLFFDVTEEVSEERLAQRSIEQNRLDNEKKEFKRRVFEGYHERLVSNPHRMVRIDANKPIVQVCADVTKWMDKFVETLQY